MKVDIADPESIADENTLQNESSNDVINVS
jgi:hypothetical protein